MTHFYYGGVFPRFDSPLSLDVVSIKLGAAHQTQTVLFRMNIYVDIVIQFHFFSYTKELNKSDLLHYFLPFTGLFSWHSRKKKKKNKGYYTYYRELDSCI